MPTTRLNALLKEPEASRGITNRRRAAANPSCARENRIAVPCIFKQVDNKACCEGRAAFASIRAYDVFDIRRIDDGDFSGLPWLSELKLMATV